MIKLYDSQLTDILPDSLKNDPGLQAISYALQKQNQKILTYLKAVKAIMTIDTLSKDVVDLMAAEYKTQYYSADLDLAIKRKLVKNTVLWHMKAGTTGCVEELVNTIFGYGNVEEWFDYEGEPYHFKTTVDTILDQHQLVQFAQIIKKAKNARSIMDGFNKYNLLENTVKFASGVVRTKYIKIGGERCLQDCN